MPLPSVHRASRGHDDAKVREEAALLMIEQAEAAIVITLWATRCGPRLLNLGLLKKSHPGALAARLGCFDGTGGAARR